MSCWNIFVVKTAFDRMLFKNHRTCLQCICIGVAVIFLCCYLTVTHLSDNMIALQDYKGAKVLTSNLLSKDTFSLMLNRLSFTKSHTPTVTKCTPQQRRKFVREQCEIMHQKEPNNSYFTRDDIFSMSPTRRKMYSSNLLVDDKHKLLFCSNAKVGATTYKYLLASHSDRAELYGARVQTGGIHSGKYLEGYNLTCGGKFSDDEMLYRLQNYRKVMTVRDPMLRVFSSYREKLATVKPPKCQPYQGSLGKTILSLYRDHLTPEEEKCGYTVTTPEFIKYIATNPGGKGLLRSDPHWNEFYKKCQPCVIDYDYYIRIETGDSDQEYFLQEYLKSGQVTKFSGNNIRFNNVGNTSETRLAENEYSQLSEHYTGVNRSDFEIIKEHYKIDSLLFGYEQTLLDDGMVSKCRSTNSDDTFQCC